MQAKSESERDEWMQLARNLVRHNPGLLDRFHPGVFAGGENYLPLNVNYFYFREMALLWRNAKELLRVPGDIMDTSADQVRTSSTSSSHRPLDPSLGRRGGRAAGGGGSLPFHCHRAG